MVQYLKRTNADFVQLSIQDFGNCWLAPLIMWPAIALAMFVVLTTVFFVVRFLYVLWFMY